jgi:hypothetical protein
MRPLESLLRASISINVIGGSVSKFRGDKIDSLCLAKEWAWRARPLVSVGYLVAGGSVHLPEFDEDRDAPVPQAAATKEEVITYVVTKNIMRRHLAK